MGRINTKKTFGNEGYYNGGLDTATLTNGTIQLSPLVSDQYDYSVTEDPVLLQERKDTADKLYEIYNNSPFKDEYTDYLEYEDETGHMMSIPKKIPKEDIVKVFSYMKEHLLRVKKLSAFETVIAINEFFDFNYDYVIKKVLSSKMMAELLEDYYVNMGMSSRMDESAEMELF